MDGEQQFGELRQTTAFFVTREAAEKAVRDLAAIGYSGDRVKMEQSAEAEGGLAQSDAERGEGRGQKHGYIVRVQVSAADFDRVSACLDDEATMAMDARNSVSRGASASFGGSGVRGSRSGRSGSGSGMGAQAADIHVPSMDEVMGYVRDKPLHALGIAFAIGFVLGRR
ncbi:hypothetical protein SLNSH_22445 [Alsobacter soli]|uniref:Uncharacterized protein n=1 Tax=Alsobacter soli TaxID=2109933 RepID=A0A2T1HM62_9HYPH|nr:hypothetical protein [Alsobacter soli]PSC02744.1 hypothetical protein SLNSH_22445 [Alsobacter soli]